MVGEGDLFSNCLFKGTQLSRSEQTFIRAWNRCPSNMNTVTENYWLISAAATVIWPYHVGIIFSHGVNLKLALRFHALLVCLDDIVPLRSNSSNQLQILLSATRSYLFTEFQDEHAKPMEEDPTLLHSIVLTLLLLVQIYDQTIEATLNHCYGGQWLLTAILHSNLIPHMSVGFSVCSSLFTNYM